MMQSGYSIDTLGQTDVCRVYSYMSILNKFVALTESVDTAKQAGTPISC